MTKECIRCTNTEQFCICPDDMTFEEKFFDVISRCSGSNDYKETKLREINNWRDNYLTFFAKYFKFEDEGEDDQ